MPNHTLLFSILISFLLQIDSVDADCQTGYTSYNNETCYKVHASMKTRAAAEVQCKSDGGYLASPSNGFDNSYVLSLGQNASASSMWLGIECFDGKKSECWNDDETTFGPYYNFYSKNPSTVGNCVYMSTVTPAVGSWLSFNCSNSLPFVCEQDFGDQQGPPKPCPDQFSFCNGMCYAVIHNRTMVSSDAVATCQQFAGGNLTSIPSAKVNQFLYNMTTAYPNQDHFWLGMKCPTVAYDGDISSCYWFDNTPINYTKFESDVPHNGYPWTIISRVNLGKWSGDTGRGSHYPICQVPPL